MADYEEQKKSDHVFSHVIGEVNLRIKLKITNDQGFQQTERVCHICKKVFLSGKALGGHMRIHNQQKNGSKTSIKAHQPIKFKKQNPHEKSEIALNGLVMEKPTCAMCGRDFPSTKALSGHMRCHPDRSWKGIKHPQQKTVSNSSSSSSSLSHYESDQSSKNLTDDEKISNVNLVEPLKWTVTGKRGRKFVSSDELRGVANNLMILARSYSSMTHNEKTVAGESINKLDGQDLINEAELESVISKKMEKKRKKVVKLCDLDSGATPHNHKVVVATTSDHKYKCNMCVKSFKAHQALGGHVSGHNKSIKISIHNSCEKTVGKVEAPLTQVGSPDQGINTCRRVLDFDLNVKLPSDDEEGFEPQTQLNQ